ncbi:MAG: methyltransferase domain-containing protein [Egibacteraceae bacterium]
MSTDHTVAGVQLANGRMIDADGVYAAGNIADVSHQVLQAAAEGSQVAGAINADLAHEDASLALAALSGDGSDDWDRRYAQQTQRWSGQPNATLIAEVERLDPGSALDVCCGEGADAIWLALQGWDITGADISQIALDRARRVAADTGVDIDWVQADIAVEPPERKRYDLVSVSYPALPHTPGDDAIHALIDAVAPGGTLLVVGHDLASGDGHRHHAFDPCDYVQPADVAQHLDATWTIDVHQTRPRTRPPGVGPDVPDVVLRAHRTEPTA